MDDEEKAELVNEITLNDKDVAEAYAVQMKDADDCIQDFYLQIELSASYSFNHKAITVSTKKNNRIYYNINLAQ